MAVVQVEFRSKTLKRQVSFRAILPTENFELPYPTLYLLHGLTDDSSAWLYNTRIRMWAEQMGLAVILPSGENSFYLDVPVKDGCYGDFGEYIGRELVAVTRKMFPLSHKREDTFIGGLSMGGYGACRNGLKYCDTFGKVAMLSAAVHFFENSREWVHAEGNTIGELQCIGDLDTMEHTDRTDPSAERRRRAEPLPGFLRRLRHRGSPDRGEPLHLGRPERSRSPCDLRGRPRHP